MIFVLLLLIHAIVVAQVFQLTKNEVLPEIRLASFIPVVGETILLVLLIGNMGLAGISLGFKTMI